MPPYHQDTYAEFLDVLSDPVDGHSFILPYDQGEITITGRVQPISDEYEKLPGGKRFWKGTTFSIIANHPSKEMSLDKVLARGRTPLPEISEVQRGDMYTYTSTGWVKTVFTDADAVYY